MAEPVSIKVELSTESKAVIERLSSAPDLMLGAIATGMNRGLELMLGQITIGRFTGKGPFPVSQHKLGVRTNRLRSSLRRSVATIEGTSVSATVGSNVEYFGIHEFGFNGTVNVGAHQRKAPLGDRFAGANGGTLSRAAARKAGLVDRGGKKKDKAEQVSSRIATVKAHTRKVNIEARAPLTTGIEDHKGILVTEITKDLTRALEGNS